MLNPLFALPSYDGNNDDENIRVNTQYLESLLEELLTSENLDKDQTDYTNDGKSCLEKYRVYDQNIIHTRKSIENGARFLDVKTIPRANSMVLYEKCINLCCYSSDKCDTTLLSLKPGDEGYRCYLFYCDSKCSYEKHEGYSILTLDYELNIKRPTEPVSQNKSQNQSTLNFIMLQFEVDGCHLRVDSI